MQAKTHIMPAPHVPPPRHEQLDSFWGNGSNSNDTTTLWPNASSILPGSPNTTEVPIHYRPCQWILYTEINHSRVRVWDLIIFVPNVLFLLFLLLRFRTAIVKLRRTSSPIFSAFYALVMSVAVISVLRCVVAMTVNAAMRAGDITDKVLWLMLRFTLLATELSVVIFGLAFGHLDSKTSIRRVLVSTFSLALVYSVTQGVLEFENPDDRFHVHNGEREYDIFGHGGMLFWFACSVFFFIIYSTICILPWTKLRERFALPSRRSFYMYCFFLACLNATQAVGSGLLYYHIHSGMCIVDVTAYIYFTCFAPLVYGTFLKDFFATSHPPNILFSYKAQVDDDEDNLSLPNQTYIPAPQKPPDDEPTISQSFDSTHFDAASPNPLYDHMDSDLHLGINADINFSHDYFSQNSANGPRLAFT